MRLEALTRALLEYDIPGVTYKQTALSGRDELLPVHMPVLQG